MNKSGNFIRPRPRSAPTPDGRHPCIPFSCRRNVDNLSVPRNGTGNSTTVPQRRGGRGRCERVSRPFRAGGNGRMPDPGRRCALPWAGISRPFRRARANLSVPRNVSVPKERLFICLSPGTLILRAGGNGRMPDPGRRCALPWAGISRPFRPARANLSVPRNAPPNAGEITSEKVQLRGWCPRRS